ncbi:MAG: tripartite tricarboxylate transporter TctB family protein [Pseudomonadota bacterium]
MKFNDAIFGLLFVALGGAVLFAVRGYPSIPGQQVGPALFPGLIAVGLCIAGLVLIVTGVMGRAGQPWMQWEDWVRSPRHVIALAVLIGSIVFYIAASNWLGFLPIAFLILMAMLLVLRVRVGLALAVAVVATLVIHFAFYKLLRVPLPWGLLTPWAW